MAESKRTLAATGSVGNNTHSAVDISDWTQDVCVQFIVEAVGATPTVTWKAQGSLDGTNWYDLAYITDSSDTVAVATRSATATGGQLNFLSLPFSRQYNYMRLVTSANTNVTYRGEIYGTQR